mgnify:CR=1 FL=1
MEKVSVIVPCYNVELYLLTFIDNLLKQDYDDIEVIFVNDGSPDKSEDIIKENEERIRQRGYEIKYIKKKNGGLASAVNAGLKAVTGDYVIWPDPDDIMFENNISRKVEALNEDREAALAICTGKIVDANDISKELGILKYNMKHNGENLFEDYIYERNVVFAPVAFMVRMKTLDEVIPNRDIYPGREGQNFQILLPIIYSKKCICIEDCLYKYLVHADSHSHQKRNLQQWYSRFDGIQDNIIYTINAIAEMPQEEKKMWEKKTRIKYLRKKMYLQFHYRNYEEVKTLKVQINEMGGKSILKDSWIYMLARNLVYGERV